MKSWLPAGSGLPFVCHSCPFVWKSPVILGVDRNHGLALGLRIAGHAIDVLGAASEAESRLGVLGFARRGSAAVRPRVVAETNLGFSALIYDQPPPREARANDGAAVLRGALAQLGSAHAIGRLRCVLNEPARRACA